DRRSAQDWQLVERIGVDRPRLLLGAERRAVEAYDAPAAVKYLGLGRFAGRGRKAVEVANREQVIGIKEERELSAEVGKRRVPRRTGAAIWLALARDRAAIPGEDRRSCVGRAVVDYDQLERRAVLGEHTVDRVGDERLAVVYWDDDTNEWR